MLGFLKKKSKLKREITFNYESIKVDMHSHVLPGIDDGAQTPEESIVLVKKMMELGIEKIIATPHIMADFYKLNSDDKIKLIIAANLHDIGKLAVPNSILDSPNKLDNNEFEVIKEHTYYTRIALQEIKGFADIPE